MDQEILNIVNKLPEPDERGLMSNIDKEVVDKVTAGIMEAGPKGIIGVVDMLVEPGKGDDYKAHYALHCLAIHVGKEREDERQTFSKTLASRLEEDYPKAVKKYLIRELQIAGGPEVTASLGRYLLDEELCEPAAQALTAIRVAAADQFRNALPKASDKCRVTIRQNLELLSSG